jgi:hypothetical protein
LLWKTGEKYRIDPQSIPPSWWVPALNTNKAQLGAVAASGIVERLLPLAFTPGRAVTVTLNARPSSAVQAYAIEERPPIGWIVQDSGEGSVTAGGIRFGPFFDSQPRALTYTVVSTSASANFGGTASFDGSDDIVAGATTLRTSTPIVQRTTDGKVRLSFHATAGESFLVESAASLDAVTWDLVTTIQGADTAVDLPLIEPVEQQRFYRLRPAQ